MRKGSPGRYLTFWGALRTGVSLPEVEKVVGYHTYWGLGDSFAHRKWRKVEIGERGFAERMWQLG